jgi:hypothetical protein
MDNTAFVRMRLRADKTYTSSSGAEVTPSLDIQCNASPRHASIAVYFYTGLVEAASDVNVRIKVDNDDPFYITYFILPDGATLQYIAPSSLVDRMSPLEFVAILAMSKTVLVEFNPRSSPNKEVARFNTSGLLNEFKKHTECVSQVVNR